ncbi:CHAT domain-containing protein [Pseudanabaena yagii]|uniref:Tetratricopeptide repeat protein n=1 Tax=Pseudanabaena yagii GIHE-NHR1 TaxID=2722753 RepID=A0ABX1LVM3_9CYAN|nr:tetratricopeptide repeat protein [Pseudanabaena yagii]NMF59066.1 tetratricopeptide repeat protein [Pseudanabaena yagii GIHE-NHR1]
MMPHRKKSSKLAHFFLLPFSLCLVGGVAVSEVVLAKTAEERKAEEDRILKSCRDNLNAQKFQEGLLACQGALEDFKKTDNLRGQGIAITNIGFAYASLNQYQKAIDNLQQALKIVREVKDRRIEAISLGNLGRAYVSLNKYDKAIEVFLQTLVILREIKDRLGEGRVLISIGLAYDALGKYDKAIEYQLQSLAIAREIKDRLGEGASLGNLGLAYRKLGKYDKEFEFQLQSLEIAREIKDRRGEGQSLGNLGLAYTNLGKYEKAIEYQLQSLAIAREIKDRLGEGNALGNLGLAYTNLGKYEKAIEYQLQSLAIAREIKNRLGEGNALGNLGNAYYSLGKYDKAIENLQQVLAIAREIKDRLGEGNTLGNLGGAYQELGKYDKAIEFNLQSLEIKREIKDRLGEGRALGNLGQAYRNLGKYDKAIEYYLQSLAISQEVKNRQGEGEALGNLGLVHSSIGKYDRAINFHLQSLAIAREIKYRRGEISELNNLAIAYDNLNRDQEVMISLQQALTIAREIGDRNVEGYALANLGIVLSRAKRPELAILFYKQSINVREAIRKDIKKLDKDLQQSYLATVESTYRALADILLQQNRIIEALQVLDLLKVQELEDYLKNIKGSDRSAQGVRLLAPELAISDKLLTINPDNSQDINNQLANQIQQLPKTEINKVPDYLNQIPQGTVLLYPFILGDRLEIILFAPNNLPIRRTTKISKDQLETLINDFRSGLLDAGSEDFKEPSIQLYNLLIKPIEAELVQFKAKTILYAPDGQLRYIPIAALYDGKQWLVEKYQISNLIAYTLFDFSSQPKNAPNILAGAFGGKAGDRKFGQTALPATVREVQAIANSFQNSVTLIEEQFSRQAIESKFKNHNILHLATHAEFNTGAPDNSFIIFGNGDKIRLNEITDWQIPNIDLIILSACQTGVGKLGSGVEILGFGYQVQKAGAKQAIASLWSVNDDGTQALMAAFYRELQKGDVTAIEALHRAQVTLIKSDKFNHPNYWSAFFAISNGL